MKTQKTPPAPLISFETARDLELIEIRGGVYVDGPAPVLERLESLGFIEWRNGCHIVADAMRAAITARDSDALRAVWTKQGPAILGRMVTESASDIGDAELTRTLAPCVAGPWLVRIATAARDAGLFELDDLDAAAPADELSLLGVARGNGGSLLMASKGFAERAESLVRRGLAVRGRRALSYALTARGRALAELRSDDDDDATGRRSAPLRKSTPPPVRGQA
jgi:hypothetical protein